MYVLEGAWLAFHYHMTLSSGDTEAQLAGPKSRKDSLWLVMASSASTSLCLFIMTVSFIGTSWFSYGKSTLILGTLSQSESYPLVPVVDSVPGLGTNWANKMAEIPGLV